MQEAIELLSAPEVLARCRMSQATMTRLRARGEFPEPLVIGPRDNNGRARSVAWPRSVIEEWCASRRVVEGVSLYGVPSGEYIAVAQQFKRARDAEQFAVSLINVGARVHAVREFEFRVWFDGRGRSERLLTYLKREVSWVQFRVENAPPPA